MEETRQNYYGHLCTEMYELLHPKAPQDELDFYLSYAEKGQNILEPLCGSGRFFVPFLERGMNIQGVDLSGEMLEKLRQKAPHARVVQADLAVYAPKETFDYIFIPAGSVSLFTDISLWKRILSRLHGMLAPGGRFVFAVDTIACRCPDDSEGKIAASVKTVDGLDLILRTRDFYDPESQTQFSPGSYELYRDGVRQQQEIMDFQIHLYRLGEMEEYLNECGFSAVTVYSSFQKEPAGNALGEMLLYECIR